MYVCHKQNYKLCTSSKCDAHNLYKHVPCTYHLIQHIHPTLAFPDGDGSIGYWTTLLDADVSHKTLMALIYCLLERTKQVCIRLVFVHVCLTSFPGSLISFQYASKS